jgi:hypothetical protein
VSLRLRCAQLLFVAFLVPAAANAQQTGSVTGRVVDSGGGVLPGVTVEARSDVLPAPRVTTTDGNGVYRLPALQPGTYTITFELSGMATVTRQAQVQLAQETALDATMDIAGLTETVVVTASASLIERDSASIKSGLSNEQIMSLPVGQEYRDLVRLIPGVQVTQDQTRGPSAGGSGQDNVYQFDGANVTLPLFGTLSAEPASHDIAQVTTIKGGGRAIDFDRSGGFTIDTVSKSGGSRYAGEVSFQFQDSSWTSGLASGVQSRYEQDRSWIVASLGGPVIANRLHFYGSYYRPENRRENRANLYGDLPQYRRTRNEGFGKLTFTPTGSALLNFSYRDSKREDRSALFASNASPTTGTGDEGRLRIGIAEGSWILNSRSHVTFKYSYFGNETLGRPDNISSAAPSSDIGARIDVANLDQQGRLTVPVRMAGLDAYNAFIQPLIDRYSHSPNGGGIGGVRPGVQRPGLLPERRPGRLQPDARHTHRARGARRISALPRPRGPGAQLERMGRHHGTGRTDERRRNADLLHRAVSAPDRRRRFSHRLALWLAERRDQRHDPMEHVDVQRRRAHEQRQAVRTGSARGQLDDLRLRGRAGQQVQDVRDPVRRMIQPRLGATWAYNGRDTVYTGYARYNPAASSLPRAASWDRNLIGTFIDAHFDQNGVLFAAVPVGSSSGKLFVDDLTPRTVDEFVVGTARQLAGLVGAALRAVPRGQPLLGGHEQQRARRFNPPPDIPRELYIPDLTAKLQQIGSGSTYVIAELDGAYTRYYEATVETEWRGTRAFARGSYTWSKYYGNFDQDNTTGLDNDMNIFIGSSNIADGAGRQLWDNKDGRLRGDRPHMLKLYGFYTLAWNATVGAFAVAQSGHPWEAQSYLPYVPLVGTSTSDSNRYAEPAGSRRTDAHWQLDLNYTQNFRLPNRMNLQIAGDLFNVFDKQTGYNPQPSVQSSVFGQPRNYWDPRRFQLAARLRF